MNVVMFLRATTQAVLALAQLEAALCSALPSREVRRPADALTRRPTACSILRMTSISLRTVLLACCVATTLGLALPHVAHLSAQAQAATVEAVTPPTVTPTAVAPGATDAVPLQDASCGDGQCSPPEDCNTCPRDCGNCCGDRRCLPPEDCHSCPSDCGGC